VSVDESMRGVGEVARTRATIAAPTPTFMVAGEPYLSGGAATTAVLAAVADLAPSTAYHVVRRAANAGRVRTVPVGRHRRWYHHDDVLALADELRDK
jgi:hypothetical protein